MSTKPTISNFLLHWSQTRLVGEQLGWQAQASQLNRGNPVYGAAKLIVDCIDKNSLSIEFPYFTNKKPSWVISA
jgi:hypothetical protein